MTGLVVLAAKTDGRSKICAKNVGKRNAKLVTSLEELPPVTLDSMFVVSIYEVIVLEEAKNVACKGLVSQTTTE